MHIVIDTRIIESSTGRYMQRLVENLHEITKGDGNSYTVLVPSPHVAKWSKILPDFDVVAADQKWYTFSEQISLLWQLYRLKPDLVHFTMPQQPLLWFGAAVTTIHDTTLIRFDNIDDMNPIVYKIKKFVFIVLARTVLARAKQILTPTEFVRQDIADYFGKKYLKKITVTLEAGEIPTVEPEVMSKYKGKKYIFFVGNAFPFKNIKRTILAHAEIVKNNPDIHLLLAGKKDFFYEELEKFTLDNKIANVHFLGFISDGEKRWALQNAVAFVTASTSEGFCIPLLEAMYENCPVISSNASCLPEVAGEAALYFDPGSTNELVSQIKKIMNDDTVRKSLIRKGQKRVKNFSWQKMTKETYEIYKKYI